MPQEVTVELYGSLTVHTGGERHITVAAENLRDLYQALGERYPGLQEHLEDKVSVSIDGRIYTEALFEKIGPENELVLLPRIAGG